MVWILWTGFVVRIEGEAKARDCPSFPKTEHPET